ncbi:MAG: phosphoribosylformylglycinamidine synthase [Gammaproteobacteria bacterium]|nr:phosphoribosylformylglycinamidine synthase [Gammaproteobacteria bacterium]
MLVIPGPAAISDFRREKVLWQVRHAIPRCNGIETRLVYFLDTSETLGAADRRKVAQLLNVNLSNLDPGRDVRTGVERNSLFRVIVPRIGTISPWATKATDIFHQCGLDQVLRIERGTAWIFHTGNLLSGPDRKRMDRALSGLIFDPMTESMLFDEHQAEKLFARAGPAPLRHIDLMSGCDQALRVANAEFGFALSDEEQDYLLEQFRMLGRNPTDAELMMFSQVNSEHCRHKIFNAQWKIDDEIMEQSLFAMIRHTHEKSSSGILVAYSDNAAVLTGAETERFSPDAENHRYGYTRERVHFTAKVETHNHPTAISPYPGASTGSGGEIRDEGATGRGGKPKAGLVGYSVSHLRIPDFPMPWEGQEQKPARIAGPLQIMIEGPIGAAAFNNEFGRPNICGYFRNMEYTGETITYGYHKPIMLAGGIGNIRPQHVHKKKIPVDTPIVVLGGPSMLIGLGGGAASSVTSGSRSESLDFASVQRGNPEMQRRCQEVIDACCAMGRKNPILSVHDVGAGGLCNALPELVHNSECGGSFELRDIPNDEPGMSPMQIWCNESQERYVLAIDQARYGDFEKICARERCLYSKVGVATTKNQLVLNDRLFPDENGNRDKPIDLPMDLLFGLPPKMQRTDRSMTKERVKLDLGQMTLHTAVEQVLMFPAVGDKTFLVTIGDRSVTGLITRDQMVGPWQVPVADVGVAASGYRSQCGEACAIGERTPVAIIDAPASGRLAVAEAVTNMAAAAIGDISNIKLSANWMAAAGEPGHDADLYATVRAIALEFCPDLGISIPVGKDSMSMKSVWQDESGHSKKVVAPVSLIVSAFAPVEDVGKTLTPVLDRSEPETDLWLFDLGGGKNRLGGSILAQTTNQMGETAPDLEDAKVLKNFFNAIQTLIRRAQVLAYHDRSDGGLIITLCEMAFASRCGLQIDLGSLGKDYFGVLFNEETGAVIQTRRKEREGIRRTVRELGLENLFHRIGQPVPGNRIHIMDTGKTIYAQERSVCHAFWSRTGWQMQRLRDNPACADQEYSRIQDTDDPGLFCELGFEHSEKISRGIFESAGFAGPRRPKIAILREQGVNGQLEMAAAFHSVGFEAVDVTTTDLTQGKTLDGFKGIAACGGFSFGDVLGAGEGWGKSILYNPLLRDTFEAFFNRQDTFALGVCNGCQMMTTIKDLVPGAKNWPRFLRNRSEQYEARFVMVEICSEKAVLFAGMGGSKLPVVVAHGEGRAVFEGTQDRTETDENNQVCLRYVDHRGQATEVYPYNPNHSDSGFTAFTNDDGRFTIMMPHPERVFRTVSNSWHPPGWGEYSPWIRIFQNARHWVEQAS